MIILYRLLWCCLLPIFLVTFVLRVIKGKEHKSRFLERFGLSRKNRPTGPLIWFHCASVGESLSILKLIKVLLESDRGLHVLVTTGTVTSAKIMADKLPERAFHQFVPIDFYPCVKAFLRRFKPDLAVFVESEFWPELLTQAPQLMLINARMSDRSYRRYLKIKPAISSLLRHVTQALCQTAADATRLQALGCANTTVAGHLKYDISPQDVTISEQLAKHTAGRYVIVAASTHRGEEQLILQQFAALSSRPERPFLIIVPRHPHRGTEVLELVKKAGFSGSARQISQDENVGSDVYVADTIGEMPLWYTLADSVVVGGSFIPHGGQNPYEPTVYGKHVVCGPHMFNFTDMATDLKQRGVMIQLPDATMLAETVIDFMLSFEEPSEIQEKISDLGGATARTKQVLEQQLAAQEGTV